MEKKAHDSKRNSNVISNDNVEKSNLSLVQIGIYADHCRQTMWIDVDSPQRTDITRNF